MRARYFPVLLTLLPFILAQLLLSAGSAFAHFTVPTGGARITIAQGNEQCLDAPETVTVSATSQDAVLSETVLQAGKSYLLVSSGVFSYWDPSGQTAGADSLYEYRNEAQPNLWSPLWVNNKELRTYYPNEAAIPKYSSDHLYRAVITGDGNPATFKINEGGGYNDNSGALSIALCETTTNAPTGQLTLRTGKDSYSATEGITVEYSGLTTTQGNWITVVDAAAKPETYGAWQWLDANSGGALTFGPHPAGSYEARLFLNWPSGGYNIAARYPFRVQGAGTGAMTLEAPRLLALPDSERLVEIKLSNAANVANMNFDLQYDSAVIALDGDPFKGNLLDNALFTPNASQAGVIRSGFAQTSGITSPQPGTVLNIPIRVIGEPGDKSPLHLSVTTINDPNGGTLSIEQIHGEILITNLDGTLPGGGNGGGGSGGGGGGGGGGTGGIPQGDCNGDLRVTELDALCALEMSVDLRDDLPNMDVDNSGLPITSRDAVVILQRAVGQ